MRVPASLFVTVIVVVLGFSPPSAMAESDSRRVEAAAFTCANWVTSGSTNIPLDCAIAAASIAIVPTAIAQQEAWRQVDIAGKRLQTTKVGDRLFAIVGEALSQFQRLSGLKASFDVDATNGRVAAGANFGSTSVYYNVPLGAKLICTVKSMSPCLTVLDSRDSSRNDSVSKFVWNNNAKLYADPDTQECKCMSGQGIWTIYTAESQPRPEFEFLATSQKSSISPVRSGWKMKEVSTFIRPASNRRDLEIADFDPYGAGDYGNGGSFSLGASLSGEFGAGGTFSIGRTWSFPKGYAGGGLLHNDEHYTIWRTAGSGDPYARGTAGVETWKEPAGARAQWEIGGWGVAGT